MSKQINLLSISKSKKTSKKRQLKLFENISKPKEIQTSVVKLKRKNGKVIQNCDVYIGRACYMGGWELEKSKWANPFTIKEYGSAEEACNRYKEYIVKNEYLMSCLYELDGKVLGCWCKDKSTDFCHGDVLIELIKESKESKEEEDEDFKDFPLKTVSYRPNYYKYMTDKTRKDDVDDLQSRIF
jgi:hypothetical protein